MTMAALQAALARLRGLLKGPGGPDAARKRVLRRQQLLKRLERYLPLLSIVLVLAGYLYLFAIPWAGLGRGTYMSENAIQPAQVNTYWNWGEVYTADRFEEDLIKWDQLPAQERADKLKAVFAKHGLRSETQAYSFGLGHRSDQTYSGVNTHAIMRTTKTDGVESIVVSASWRSRDNGRLNARGIATLLVLSKYLSKLSVWSKDIIFIISDGYLDGMQAWVAGWHAETQSNLQAEPITLKTGPIWAALNVDYPHHSFSHLGIFFESANGLLPNLDFINAAIHISRWAGGSPVRLHADDDSLRERAFGGPFDSKVVKEYERSAKTALSQVKRQATGSPSGPEGVFARYRIDAITLFAVPAEGPHGFYSIGKTIESNLRSINNLLERFHQSFFLYLMTSPDSFVSVANYLAAPMLVSVGLTVEGLRTWASLFPKDTRSAPRPVATALTLVLATHLTGLLVFLMWTVHPAEVAATTSKLSTIAVSVPTAGWLLSLITPPQPHLAATVHCFSLLVAGAALAVVSTLNFSLGVLVSFIVAPTLMLARRLPWPIALLMSAILSPAALGAALPEEVHRLIIEWRLLDTWFLPYMAVVVMASSMQCAVVQWLRK